jgi:hypothetical protein
MDGRFRTPVKQLPTPAVERNAGRDCGAAIRQPPFGAGTTNSPESSRTTLHHSEGWAPQGEKIGAQDPRPPAAPIEAPAGEKSLSGRGFPGTLGPVRPSDITAGGHTKNFSPLRSFFPVFEPICQDSRDQRLHPGNGFLPRPSPLCGHPRSCPVRTFPASLRHSLASTCNGSATENQGTLAHFCALHRNLAHPESAFSISVILWKLGNYSNFNLVSPPGIEPRSKV